jgi:hypothetical protein
MIQLILDSAPEIGGQYSLVVNKLSPALYDLWTREVDLFPGLFFRDFPVNLISNHIFYLQNDEKMGKNDLLKIGEMQGIAEFLKDSPCIDIHPERVSPIMPEQWDVMVANYQRVLDQMQLQHQNKTEMFKQILEEVKQKRSQAQVQFKARQAEVAARCQPQVNLMNEQIAHLASRSGGEHHHHRCSLF